MNTNIPRHLLRRWLFPVLILGIISCDDEPLSPEIYELSFVLPEEGATLGCGDDLNRSTLEEIDIAVSLSALVPEDERDDLIIELRVSPESFSPQRRTLTEGGRVIFDNLPLPTGSYELSALLLNGAAERANATLNLEVEIDIDSPLCGVSESSLEFLSPVNGAVIRANDDLDSDLTNGVQIAVEVEVQGQLVTIGEQVQVEVNGASPSRAQVEGGVASFESVTLPLSGTHQLRAIATGPNGLLESIIEVEVNASACELTLSPSPMEGCDIGATADVIPDREGLQAELSAETDCEQVVWTVNGQTYPPVDNVDGTATFVVTLNGGENTVSARAQSENGLSAEAPTYVLDVDLTDPELNIDSFNEIGVNRRGLEEAINSFNDAGEPIVQWRVNGFTSDLPPNAVVNLEIIPELVGAPAEVTIGEDGRFSVLLEGDYICGRQLTLSSVDLCGGTHSSPSYSFCFDGVTPRLSIVEPANLSLINTDLDLEAEGLQTDLTVSVEDSRESEDYPIEIRCARGTGGAPEVLSISSILKSELSPVEDEPGVSQGLLRVTFPRADRYSCRPVAMTGQNEPILATSLFRVITDEPIFEVLDPTVVPTGNGRTYACFSNTLFIGGQGSQFSEEDTQLSFTLYNEAGQAARFGQLEEAEDGFYNASLNLDNQQLADGRYTLEISGTSGTVEVSVIPSEPIEILIDNEVPVVGPLSPANGILTLANDENSDLNDCIQSSVEFSLSDESAERVCFSLNGGTPVCAATFDQGVVRTPEFNFLPGDNVINMQVIDCTGASSSFNFSISAEGCQAPLRITNLTDGGGVTFNDDIDAELEGIQLPLSLSGSAEETISIEVSIANTESVTYGPITLDMLGQGEVTITAPVAELPLDVTIQPTSMSRSGQLLRLTTYAVTPALTTRPLEGVADCLNRLVKDRSSAEGFQLQLVVDAEGLSESSLPQVSSYCQQADSDQRVLVDQQTGVSVNLGQSALITFSSITLSDGECDLELTATDVSGEIMTGQLSLTVDRTPPQIDLLVPDSNEPLNLLNDINNDVPGIQFPARFNVCGAAGQNITIDTDPAQTDGPRTTIVDDGSCSTVEIEELTFVNGDQLLNAEVTDACGNPQTFEQNIQGNTGVTVVIIEPNNQQLIGVRQDRDLTADGCQIEVNIISTGFSNLEDAEFALCATNQAGELSPLCGNQTDASQGGCISNDDQGSNISCPVTLSDGEHELSIVARENGVDLRSNSISVKTDCTAPRTVSIQIAEDLNADQCINSQERANFDSNGSNAIFNIDFEVNGIADGRSVIVRALPGQQSLGAAEVTEGRGVLNNINLPSGEYFLYLSGIDEVGNTLPSIEADDFQSIPLLIDTQAPTPSLLQPLANQCINIANDLEPQAGAQYQPVINTGAVDSETVALSLNIDGIIVQRENTINGEYTFATILLNEGDHTIAVISEDLCGNAGSVAGFETDQGRPNWNAPISLPISVDLTAPTLTLGGISDDQVLNSADDANQSPADGFQVNITIDASNLEPGQEIKVYSGEERLPTLPVQLFAPVDESLFPLNATLTLPPGPHALSLRAADLCANGSSSPVKEITIDIEGCSSQITSLISGQLFGPSQGTVTPEGKLRINVSGQVDLLDPSCANAQAELLLNGTELLGSTTIDPTSGAVVFNEVSIPEGQHSVATRVRLNNEETYSLGKSIFVDLIAPNQISIITPELNELGIGRHLQDTDNEVAGQQMTLVALVNETPITSNRVARISIDGVQLPQEIEVPRPS